MIILDNTKIKCESILDLMKKSGNSKYKLNFVKHNETFCMSSLSFHWFNSTEKVALSEVEGIKKVKYIHSIILYFLLFFFTQKRKKMNYVHFVKHSLN